MSQRKCAFSCLWLLLALQWESCGTHLLGFRDECTLGKCDSGSGLSCVNKRCACDFYRVYDEDKESCVTRLHFPCSPLEEHKTAGRSPLDACPTNATCRTLKRTYSGYSRELLKALLPPNYENHFNCECDQGFTTDEQGVFCKPTLHFGDTCSGELKKSGLNCNKEDGFRCGDSGKCVCSNSKTMDYDSTWKKCFVRLGQNCTLYGHQCEVKAICSEFLAQLRYLYEIQKSKTVFSSNAYSYTSSYMPSYRNARSTASTCVCFPGYVETLKGKCVGSLGVPCSATLGCNEEGFLSCIDGICQCQKGVTQVFSEKDGKRCEVMAGSSCAVENGPPCSPNSMCRKGRCECEMGYSEASSGRCLLNFRSNCTAVREEGATTTVTCNNFRGLSCIGGQCSCFDSSLKWDAMAETCIGGEGSRCGEVRMLQASDDVDLHKDPFYPRLPSAHEEDEKEEVQSHDYAYFVKCAEPLLCDYPEMDGIPRCKKEK